VKFIWDRETVNRKECAEDTMSDDYCSSEVDATNHCVRWKEQDEVGQGKISTHIRRI
jgi:hypothetical protein